MSPILQLQRRFMELGRVRLGEKGPKGEPRKRSTFRFTTASQTLAEAVAALYGGKAQPWPDAPDGEGYWQVPTDAAELDIILPPVYSDADGSPTTSYSQFFESWSGAGCDRRCDGETEMLSGKPCLCKPLVEKGGEDARVCQVTTRISFMLPDLPGLGVWRLDSKGWNAATELPGTLDLLVRAASEQAFIPAVLRIEHRTKKVPGEGTRRFVVPVIDLPSVTIKQLAGGEAPSVLNAPRPAPVKPALPPAAPIDDPHFEGEPSAPFGEPPELPASTLSLEEQLLEACAALEGTDMARVRELIAEHAGDTGWLERQLAAALENFRLRQEPEPQAESLFQAPKGARGRKGAPA